MATTQVIRVRNVPGQTMIEWEIKDSTGVEAATANIYWDSTAGGVGGNNTNEYWCVERIDFIPAPGQATAGIAVLYDGVATTAGNILAQFNMPVTGSSGDAENVQTKQWQKPRTCQPVYPSTLQSALTTGCRFIFYLV